MACTRRSACCLRCVQAAQALNLPSEYNGCVLSECDILFQQAPFGAFDSYIEHQKLDVYGIDLQWTLFSMRSSAFVFCTFDIHFHDNNVIGALQNNQI